MARNHDVDAWLEYAELLPVLLVAEAAVSQEGWTDEDFEWYGEQLTEIGAERHLGGSLEPMWDARRIWAWERKRRALFRFAEVAPLHREAAEGYAQVMPI